MTEGAQKNYYMLILACMSAVMFGWICIDTYLSNKVLVRLEDHVRDGHPFRVETMLNDEAARLNRKIGQLQEEIRSLKSNLEVERHKKEQ